MLELIYNSAEEIPSGFESLYTEKDGKWHLTGIKGMKTSSCGRPALCAATSGAW